MDHNIDEVELFDFNFSDIHSEEEAVDYFLNTYKTPSSNIPVVFTPNVDYIVNLNTPSYLAIKSQLQKCRYIFVDGQPLIWISKFKRKKGLKRRLSGSDLFSVLLDRIKRDSLKTLFICPNDEVADIAKKELSTLHTYVPLKFELNYPNQRDLVVEELISLINENDIEVVVVGIGFPRREILTLECISHLKTKKVLFCMFGAAFEFQFRLKKRAPIILQKLGMEWFFRFLQEPKRLFNRYFVKSWKILPLAIKEITNNK